MRFEICFPPLTLLFCCIKGSNAVKCGQWYSRDCLSDSDIRYDPDFDDSIKSQDPIWARQEGYWIANTIQYDANGQVAGPTHVNPAMINGDAIPYANPRFHINITIVGSRMYSHNYLVLPPAPLDFCNQTIPPGTVNVLVGQCGVDGFATFVDNFATSSHERDGSLLNLPFTTSVGENSLNDNLPPPARFPVGSSTIYDLSYSQQGTVVQSDTSQFTDDAFTTQNTMTDVYRVENGTFVTIYSLRQFYRKVTEQEFIDSVRQAYAEFNIPQVFQNEIPQQGQCLGGGDLCPTEADWCKIDPECSVSPYQEPDGTIRPGAIAGICIVVAVMVILILFGLHRWSIVQQQKRFRTAFAARIAETVELRASRRTLTADVLAKEFAKIDEGTDGYISKEDLWEFVSSGKAGEMDQKDFNALFAALDVDHNGKVDFLEFCGFLSTCGVEYTGARERLMGQGASVRSSTHSNAEYQEIARRISDHIST